MGQFFSYGYPTLLHFLSSNYTRFTICAIKIDNINLCVPIFVYVTNSVIHGMLLLKSGSILKWSKHVFSYTSHPPSRNRAGNGGVIRRASDNLRKEIVPCLVVHDSARFYRRRDSSMRQGKEEGWKERRMHSSLRGYVTIKRRPAVFTANRHDRGYPIDRSALSQEPQPSVEQFSFFKQRQYVGSWVTALARNSYTHVRGGEGRNGGKVEWVRGSEEQGSSVVCRV